ncbi:Uncharacterised protein [Yersinia aleksiciae]|uniref:Uncharacterized protein n=1 Tax=Yersinia aleksiciae TaxID=263819 RepID=A0A0T9U2E5_YERAE|nr:Uncharacterised protein [Yersinia aleksiciae]CNL15908.1 Uncharacterised protein [Yersinia aleksiciae]
MSEILLDSRGSCLHPAAYYPNSKYGAAFNGKIKILTRNDICQQSSSTLTSLIQNIID